MLGVGGGSFVLSLIVFIFLKPEPADEGFIIDEFDQR